MVKLKDYMKDGAGDQARAVLMALQGLYGDGIKSTWCDRMKDYTDNARIGRWSNGREQGYVIYINSLFYKLDHSREYPQFNIAFFEHRNTDDICAIAWDSLVTINPPTIDDPELSKVYTDKYDVSHSVHYGEYLAMAEWIMQAITDYFRE